MAALPSFSRLLPFLSILANLAPVTLLLASVGLCGILRSVLEPGFLRSPSYFLLITSLVYTSILKMEVVRLSGTALNFWLCLYLRR
jgi:hypothetical protein